MNIKNLTFRELDELSKVLENYSIGEVLYSALRLTKANTINDLMKIKDEVFYTAINKAKEIEKEINDVVN